MKKISYIVLVLALIGGVAWLVITPGKDGKYDVFAKCIKDSGTIFYGAFWCPHCQAQKARFGKSADLLPYVECSTADSQSQTQICKDKNIQTYPTWYFASSTAVGGYEIVVGELELAQLSERTSCPLAQ